MPVSDPAVGAVEACDSPEAAECDGWGLVAPALASGLLASGGHAMMAPYRSVALTGVGPKRGWWKTLLLKARILFSLKLRRRVSPCCKEKYGRPVRRWRSEVISFECGKCGVFYPFTKD